MDEPNEYDLAAERGAKWLDKVAPGWEEHVDLTMMRMSSPTADVTAMVFNRTGIMPEGERSDPWNWLCRRSEWGEWLSQCECYIGERRIERYTFFGFSTHDSFELLTEAWQRLIEKRTGVLA